MNSFKKVLAAALSLMMLMSLIAVPVLAEDLTGGSITIKVPDSGGWTLTGAEFYVYRVLNVTGIHGEGKDADVTYAVNSDFAAFNPSYIGGDLKAYLEGSRTGAEMTRMTADLWAYIVNNTVLPTASSPSAEQGATSVTINNLPLGYYLVYGHAIHGEDTPYVVAACALDTTTKDMVVTLKLDAPSINKKVLYHINDNWQDWTDVNIDDQVDFRHISSVPVMLGYDQYRFIVHDTMSAGLTLIDGWGESDDANGFSVEVNNSTLVRDVHYSVTTAATAAGGEYSGGTEITITFDPAYFVTLTPGKDNIIINYSAILNENAVIADVGNPNKVYLEYSRNPYNTGEGETGKTPEDEVRVYTFKLDIYKFTGESEFDIPGTPLAGAKFELLKGEPGSEKVHFILISAGSETDPAQYRTAAPSDAATTELLSPESGLIGIIGLDDSIYSLIEKVAPSGFNPDTTPRQITITNEEINPVNNVVTYKINGNAPANINFYNGAGQQFPSTGGVGRTIFIAIGVALMGGAIVALVVRRRFTVNNI